MHLTLDKFSRIIQAVSKLFHGESDRYHLKGLYYNPFSSKDIVKVPCFCPSPSKLAPLIKRLEDRLGVAPAEDGRFAFKSYTTVVQELLAQDPGGVGDMPPLPFFLGEHHAVPLVVSFDAAGFGSQQMNTTALNNPHSSSFAQHLCSLGLGSCSDDRSGTIGLVGGNLPIINARLYEERFGVPANFSVNGSSVEI
eukprot:5035180-Pleurochrysis_carterae.AAC.3